MFTHLYLVAYSEWQNMRVIENERINIPNLKAHFEHLGVNFLFEVSVCSTCLYLNGFAHR